jgi:capsular exopolysaccharide synthesis family protein
MKEYKLDLSSVFTLIRRRWLAIVSFLLLGITVASIASFLARDVYTAETRLFVAIQSSGSVAELQQGNTFTQARVQSYAETASTPVVLQPVIDSLGLDVTAGQLARVIDASTDANTVLLSISARDESPVQAAAIAQAVAGSLISTVESLESSSTGTNSPVRLSVVTPAVAPATPSAPNALLNIVLGALTGITCGFIYTLLRERLDTRVRGEADIRRLTQAPVLGGITYDADAASKPLLTQTKPQSTRAESFRQIRTNLTFAQVSNHSKALVITSSLPGEGKTTTATNLAIAIAQTGQSVVLVDADLRRPRVHEYLGLEGNAGLTTALIGRASLEDLLQPLGTDGLFVLSSGQIPPNPSELLGSNEMKLLISTLESQFDAVIIDAPPLLPVTDAAVLSQLVGGMVLVIGSGRVKTADLEKSFSSLASVKANLYGVVMNLLPTQGPDAYGYSSYSYENDLALEADSKGRRRNNER